MPHTIHLCRFRTPHAAVRVGLIAGTTVHDITDTGPLWDASLAVMMNAPHQAVWDALSALQAEQDHLPSYPIATQDAPVGARLLAPLATNMEVWAAGVTYLRSRDARTEESTTKDVYQRVYEAARPELFYKGTEGSDRVVGPLADICIRGDSTWDVPEPELALVMNAHGELVGLTIGNDMSSRSIEGDNPLYLPQAKVYTGACALGPALLLIDDSASINLNDLTISLTITRRGTAIFSGQTSTTHIQRSFADLMAYLWRCNSFPNGVVLLTGTGLVPPSDITLQAGDIVRIAIDPIGELVNPVIRLALPAPR